MFDVCGTFFQSEAARRGGGIGGAVAAACLAHGRPPRVGCAHVLPAASPARASASTAQSYPCLPPAFSCAPPPAFPMRPIPAPARVLRTALSLRAAGFVRPPRERRILAGSQRVPCPPRRPARPPASPVRPIPARRGFCPPRRPARRPPASSARPIPACRRFCVPRRPARAGYCLCPAGRADIGNEPARTVPAASPCAPARVLRAA